MRPDKDPLSPLPTFALFIGVLLILFRLVRGAARDGIHTVATARRLRVLVGIGLLTFSRFVLVGVQMRADLDGTV